MIKTKEEIKLIREGGVILAEIMKKISVMIYPGMNTGELEKKANKIMQAIGARPAFKNFVMPNGEKFPTALCTSINHEIVHAPAIPSRILESGDIVGIDVGMEYPYNATRNPRNKYSRGGGYYTDMAQTFLVGDVKPEIKKLVEVTEQSLYLGLEQVKPGNTLNDIGKAIQGYVEKNGFSVVRELVGHGVGYAVHEAPQVPHYAITNKSIKNIILEPGMVLAIEPMVNVGSWKIKEAVDGFTFETEDDSLSAHFEHTIAVTEKGCEIITKFQSGQKNKEKYLGIDWGEKRIGLAIGERGSNMAIPFDVVGDINSLMKVIKNENINRLIIGNPIKMSGEKNTTKEFEIFIKKLKSILDIPMEFVDERLTSKEADALIGDKRTKAPRDSIAAMLILQQYLDRIS
ncbi:type I methionyl aminopeptidase [Candidatus Falkowbacteria bacterium RIFOXYD2_FULL_34_120]|uniref:Multifunctional fusion protein n=1 Tax=Candidatus Falkowbacteria bacterium RIFOXYD2_FULL_34_120 TaxID=1798007 RepID=A0A1F5TM33_9BACT|nr:MAG: type I methionyl aminopeptidase [Candidatus Falkowbacteria bacterium RIFOXYD12_FULL_34_57]OGF39978.1 MAG: type I methionyl aminopeptidase [Candidatus Falkowbacteria bacterium RIFOXYD2_FULL_34_120]